MVGPLSAIAIAIAAYGGYRIYGFIHAMQAYKENTKAAWVAAPPRFLQLRQGEAPDLRFFRINDEVMGGRSTSIIEIVEDSGWFAKSKALLFSGTINTNGGGFCSCRTLGDDVTLGLQNGSALLVDAVGDGQLHKLVLHTSDSWTMSVPSWSRDFIADKKRTTHKLPLSEFIPSSQGRVVKGVALDASKVTGIGFSLSLYTADGKPNPQFGDGPFRLEVHGVKEVEHH